MRFLHTADWQIGMKAAHLGEKAGQVRKARLTAARRAVDCAHRKGADFIMLCGDTFEHNGVSRTAIEEVARILGEPGCPVFVIPGNHDPAGPGSVWSDPCWSAYPGIHLLTRPQAVAVPGGTLFACPAAGGAYSSTDPTAWAAGQPGSGIRIAMAHGSVEAGAGYDASEPVARDAAARAGLDYLALGHYHSRALYRDEGCAVRMAYAGTHEPTAFGERDSGSALLVDIAGPGAPPMIEAVGTATLEWLQFRRHIAQPGELAALLAELHDLPAPERLLIECSLEGLLFADEQETLIRIQETLEERFLFGRLDDSGLHMDAGEAPWTQEIPPGYLKQTAEFLLDAARAENASALERQALREFLVIWKQVRR
jgi:DNA repair exonuclease SbcCD nuclease subunit